MCDTEMSWLMFALGAAISNMVWAVIYIFNFLGRTKKHGS